MLGATTASQYTLDGPNSGSVTGVAGGFSNIATIYAGPASDQFTITETGSLTNSIFASYGDDVFEISPGLGVTIDIDGGDGADQLTVDAGAGIPSVGLNQVSIVPGGAVVNFDDVESISAICDSCLAPLPAVIAQSANQNPSWVIGDANNDGVFDSSDLVTVFVAGEYENGIANDSMFAEGDWNGDSEFDSSDLVLAFQSGKYVAKSEAGFDELALAVDQLFADDVEEDDELDIDLFDLN